MSQPSQKKKKKFLRRGSKSGSSIGSTSDRNGDGGGSSKKSKKSFSKVRRMLSGKSKKNKSKNSIASETQSQIGDDGSNVVGVVDIAERDPVAPIGEEKKPYILKLALLLVDSVSRRFELLQLEFDSEKALVSDALSQISLHVTEKVLRGQSYQGVCVADAEMKHRSENLFTFCKGNDVLVAIPVGTLASDCAKLANPILNDDKVLAMLNASGIDASPWKKVIAPTSRAIPEIKETQQPVTTTKMYSLKELLSYMFLAVVASGMVGQIFSTPGLVGPKQSWFKEVTAPDVWGSCRSFCDAGENAFERFVLGKSEDALKELAE